MEKNSKFDGRVGTGDGHIAKKLEMAEQLQQLRRRIGYDAPAG